MNEGKAREKIDRANKADALLRNEILQDAFVYLDTQFIMIFQLETRMERAHGDWRRKARKSSNPCSTWAAAWWR